MKELNELVEQAKFVADWHGSDWSSALCQDKQGNQSHEIICESRGEAVISTGSNSNEASWLCDYLELCSPANILAIAEAFRAMEKRAEAAEAKLEGLRKRGADYILYQCTNCDQETLNYTTHCKNCGSTDITQKELFTSPSPTADLAELVPDARQLEPGHSPYVDEFHAAGWNACRAAILCKLEEAK